jgi:2-deoxy-D-gluconate 3-dehydrogenase
MMNAEHPLSARDLFDLSGRVAIVTGGNGGIGLGIAQGMAGAGASILIVGRDGAKNDEAVIQLNAMGATAIAISADVTLEADWDRVVRYTLDHFGGIDILVNNAGMSVRKAPEEYSLEEWRTTIDTNLTSAFLGTRGVYYSMKQRGGGKIINVASLTSVLGGGFNVPYTASKGGMLQLTRGLAVAWAKDNIQVNAVLPGWIDTPLTKGSRAALPGLDEKVLARTPAGRWGQPRDFAGIAVFLASCASDFVNGAGIVVDGGYSIQL